MVKASVNFSLKKINRLKNFLYNPPLIYVTPTHQI